MKMRPLGASPAPAWTPLDAPPRQPAPQPRPTTTAHAIVADRDADGLPSKLVLPGPPVADRIHMFVDVPGTPRAQWAAHVLRDGSVRLGNDVGEVLAAVRPGTPIIAACDSAGRILALTARVAPTGSTQERQRPATPSRGRTRPSDPYRHDPHEVLISGTVGRVLSVT